MFSQKQNTIEAISPNLYWDPRFEIEAAKILPGEFYVTEQHKMVVTVLGSAVCACVRDRARGIGGMNHFMLADRGSGAQNPDSRAVKYGVYAMETLIEQLMCAGAQRKYLEAKVFGGAKLMQHGSGPDIGKLTSDFLISHLKSQKIKIAAKSMGGSYPRKVYYFPRTGLVLVRRLLKANNNTILEREKEYRINLDAWA
ncbi:MAG: chemoreceptor glutamine deamidase CheD [Gammaproteobacteria bacterium]|nr:chemoreceptor glutamine deamidase CheD [Gammaproteobacteria bacterium]